MLHELNFSSAVLDLMIFIWMKLIFTNFMNNDIVVTLIKHIIVLIVIIIISAVYSYLSFANNNIHTYVYSYTCVYVALIT